MSDFIEYKPDPDSTPWQVLSFLRDNPDEELTRGDIAIKFGAMSATVDGQLQLGVAREALRKARNSMGEVVWIKGPSTAVVLQPSRLKPATSGIQLPTIFPPTPQRAIKETPDLELPEIRRGVPIVDEKTRRENAIKEWLHRFEVGDSAEFSETFVTEFKRHASAVAKASRKRFFFAKTGPKTWGLERRPDAQEMAHA